MEFDLRNETNFIKQKFLLYYITSFVLATIIIFSVYKLLPQFTQPEASTVATTLQNEEQKLLSTQDFLYKQYDEIRENSNHTLNTAGSDPQLQRNLEKLVLQAQQSFKETLDSIEQSKSSYASEQNRNILEHSVSSFRALLARPGQEMPAIKPLPVKNIDTVSKLKVANLKANIRNKEAEIASLKQQLKAAPQNTNSNISEEKYNEMVSDLKYLNFDLRSVIKQNLELAKENKALKRGREE